jgi:hypothetical protein
MYYNRVENVSVRGTRRNVLLEKELPTPSCGLIAEQWRARVNVGKQTVSGVFNVYNSGIRKFIPNSNGVNADIL